MSGKWFLIAWWVVAAYTVLNIAVDRYDRATFFLVLLVWFYTLKRDELLDDERASGG